ncbi:hypothetical protein [Alcanivorax sp. 1008]|uniref:hypothetical protein n=1 Tax=Alcanivorax sp. 1008 TaxID=2816853 RepID=UPI001D4DB94F|nr:hypothetical protein [Alcanivorax sp. 1008]MCC1498004.1 hypothetical protein [Alcanivorax sp. 1008]
MNYKEEGRTRLRPGYPFKAQRVLQDLGYAIDVARRRRRIPVDLAAERTQMSRTTWNKITKGNPTVAVGSYFAALQQVGLLDVFEALADPARDTVGLSLEAEQLPQRIRRRGSAGRTGPAG